MISLEPLDVGRAVGSLEPGGRVHTLHHEVLATPHGLCAERALLVTRFFRDEGRPGEPVVVAKARALDAILRRKVVRVHAGELLAGNFTARRVGGGLFPELHGLIVLEDLFAFDRRETNPLQISAADRWALLTEVVPYWLPRVTATRGRPLHDALAFTARQIDPTFFVINETGGISHFVPDTERLLALGTNGLRAAIAARAQAIPTGTEEAAFCDALRLVCAARDAYAERLVAAAARLAERGADPAQAADLMGIAAACARVPREPPRGLREALQATLLLQIALNLESLDNSVSPGRLDQVLWPYARMDFERGTLDAAGALELLGCFAVKLCELVPVFSRRITRFFGGMFNGQVVVVGGTDRHGADATNPLTLLFVELMDRLRTRQPNYHARLHPGTPRAMRARIARCLADGAVSPAVYNDEVIVPLLRARGIDEPDARDYATVGCVEPVAAGRSFLSTDAALFDVALCLELALGQGRRFGRRRRIGPRTAPAERARSLEDVIAAFRTQLEHGVARLMMDLGPVEEANRRWHPTPLTSLVLDGCLQAARDATAGGARYNGSGIQGVGVVEVAESLAALEAVVFTQQRATMAEVVRACRDDFEGAEALRARLLAAPKYGNDDPTVDRLVGRVMELFAATLAGRRNTRGGAYVAGFYSVTAHVGFGEIVGALPSGRRAGAPLSSGLSPTSGMARKGPTAALSSYAHLPLHVARNGVNYNLELAPWTVAGQQGAQWLEALIGGALQAGVMQLQVNVLDPRILVEARDHPGLYPGLLVRVSGYSAYFDDLSPALKQEIIDRMCA